MRFAFYVCLCGLYFLRRDCCFEKTPIKNILPYHGMVCGMITVVLSGPAIKQMQHVFIFIVLDKLRFDRHAKFIRHVSG